MFNATLVIVSTTSPSLLKFRFTKTAIVILALACLISFAIVLVLGYTFPPLITDAEHVRLESENQQLKIANANVVIAAHQMEKKLSRLEQQSQQIVALVETE